MNQHSRSLLLERLARCAEDLSAVRLAVLFGSVARRPGIAERARDIDVGVLLFEREDHLWADFRARAMIDRGLKNARVLTAGTCRCLG